MDERAFHVKKSMVFDSVGKPFVKLGHHDEQNALPQKKLATSAFCMDSTKKRVMNHQLFLFSTSTT